MNEIRELIQQLENTPEQVRSLVTGLSRSQLIAKDGDEFSILENVCHLRDIEAEGYTVRVQRILNEVVPDLSDIDGSRLAVEREYLKQDIEEALSSFASARAQTVLILNDASSKELQRSGNMEGIGQVTLERLLEMMCEHDEGHIDDLRRIRRHSGKLEEDAV